MIELYPKPILREIDATTRALRDLEAYWMKGVRWFHGRTSEQEASIYHGFPYLFAQAFPGIDADRLQRFSLATRLIADAVVIYDRLLDDREKDNRFPVDALRVQAIQFEAYSLFRELFPHDSQFWVRCRSHMRQYADACYMEHQFASNERPWGELTETSAHAIARGKSALAKMVAAGLVELAANDTLYDAIAQTTEEYHVGLQLWDDLCDWREDLARRAPTLLLLRALADCGYNSPDDADPHSVARAIYYRGHAADQLEGARVALERAHRLTAGMPRLVWHRAIKGLQARIQTTAAELNNLATANVAAAPARDGNGETGDAAEQPATDEGPDADESPSAPIDDRRSSCPH